MFKLKYPNFWSKRSWLSFVLIPISYIYIFLGYIRTKFTIQVKLPQVVICVGNITVGGAGKTQIVAWLAKLLTKKNISFVIVTKAYRATLTSAKFVDRTTKSSEVGDESILLSKFGPVIAAKKIKDSLPLIHEINPQIVILDDGMQNPLLHKNLQIVTFDSLKALGNNLIFPAGPLRESLKFGLAKADLVFIIGNNPCNDFNLLNNIYLSKKPYFKAKIKFDAEFDKHVNYIAFAGIGHPEKFYSLLAQEKLTIKKHISFEDHHNYSKEDLIRIFKLAEQNNCRLITTEKDYVKIPDKYKNLIICAKVSLEFENEEECINLIYEKLLQKN